MTSSRKVSSSVEKLLQKYKESDDDLSDLEVSQLSYSRFSQRRTSSDGTNVGVIWNDQDDIENIGTETGNNSKPSAFHPAASLPLQNIQQVSSSAAGSPSFSPFAKRIQSKIQNIEFDMPHSSRKGTPSSKITRNTSNGNDENGYFARHIFSISEDNCISKIKDENESPFIDQPIINPKRRQDPSEKASASRAAAAAVAAVGERNHKGSPAASSNSTTRTPNRKGHVRSSSVNISLTPAQRFEKRPGTRSVNALENFQFGPMVGKGAFASVYQGINLRTNQVVAIKQIMLEPDQNVGELMGEIDLLKILKHPNIVKYHGFVKTSTSLNVFLEFCSGGSLRQLYKRLKHGLPEQQIIQYVKPILHGLEYLHEQGVVHRDVKAANVLIIEETNDIKLADFGVATKVTNQYETVVGTPNWMAPETVLGGDGICTASDIWSLGATIIELFTMHPPYHELNPMATLHAIGTDEHPPLPKGLSPLGQGFLMECFQKQPNLRKTAKLLLKHKWIQQISPRLTVPKTARSNSIGNNSTSGGHSGNVSVSYSSEPSYHKSITSYTENDEDNWDNEFNADMGERILQINEKKSQPAPPRLSKSDLLTKFSDQDGEENVDDVGESVSNVNGIVITPAYEDDFDPFLELEVNSFDTNELENQSKMDYLLGKFAKRVDMCQNQDDEKAHYTILTKLAGKMLHLIKKYPVSHDVLVREHGILTILELLEYSNEFASYQKLWYYCLSILNHVFQASVIQFENFCLLGGIPMVTNFTKNSITSFGNEVRLQVVQFVQLFNYSDKALSMFIASGGLRLLSKFVEEDFDSYPEFATVSIQLIHSILGKDLTRSKSDLCRILSKYGVGFWFAVVLNRLTKGVSKKKEQEQSLIDSIVQIFKYFGQSEAKVRINIASADLFKLLIRLFDRLPSMEHQLTILKFFKSMSCVTEILRPLYNADILEFLVSLLRSHVPSENPHYKEVVNIVCPILYNCCYLNHSKELEIVKLGALPYLKTLSKINLPFRQFVLPILCEFVYCDSFVRQQLLKCDILSIYFNLIVDPYWQSNALDSILNWYNTQDIKQRQTLVKRNSSRPFVMETSSHINCFVSGFLLPKVSNLESTLDSYLKLLNTSPKVQSYMFKESIIENIKTKLISYSKNSVISLLLLRILKIFIVHGSNSYAPKETGKVFAAVLAGGLASTLENLHSRKGSVLIDEMVNEIIVVIQSKE